MQSTYSPPAAPLGPIKHRIDFKIANITFRTLHCSQPAYLRSSLHACHSTRSLRLSNTNLLSAPFVHTSFGSSSFRVAAPKIWNSLPLSLRTCTSPDTFRRHLKTHYCQHAFQSTEPLFSCASDSALLTIVRVNKLYLLTYLLHYYALVFCLLQDHITDAVNRSLTTDDVACDHGKPVKGFYKKFCYNIKL